MGLQTNQSQSFNPIGTGVKELFAEHQSGQEEHDVWNFLENFGQKKCPQFPDSDLTFLTDIPLPPGSST